LLVAYFVVKVPTLPPSAATKDFLVRTNVAVLKTLQCMVLVGEMSEHIRPVRTVTEHAVILAACENWGRVFVYKPLGTNAVPAFVIPPRLVRHEVP
jgi:hypothetical protein